MTLKFPNSIDKHIGYIMKLRRTDLGMSQEALGEKIGLSFQQIQKYEKGSNRVAAGRLYEISGILGVDIDYFFEGISNNVKMQRGMSEPKSGPGYIDFINSNEGINLNRAFTQIPNKQARLAVINLCRAMSNSPVPKKK